MSEHPDPASRPPANYRAQRRRDDRALFVAVIGVLLIVGGGLIYLIYGLGAFITGIACLLVGAGVLTLLWLLMGVLERWANR